MGGPPETALVAGAGQRTGAALARRLTDEGVDVGLLSRSGAAGIAADLDGPGEALSVRADVTDPDAVEDAVERVREAFGPVGALVHNASAPGGSDVKGTTIDEMAATWRVRAGGLFTCVQACLEDLRETRGTVVVSGTNYAIDPIPDQLQWASAAAATRAVARSLAADESLRADGVSVTYVALRAAVAPPESGWSGALSADTVADSYWSLLTGEAAVEELSLEPR